VPRLAASGRSDRPTSPLDLGLLRNRRFAGAVAVLFGLGFAMTAATIYGAATLQETLDLTPATAGLALLPLVVPLLVATRWAARRYKQVGPRVIGVRGSLALALGLLGAAARVAVDHVAVVCVALVPAGVGIGLLLSPMTNVALSSVGADKRGKASGLVSMLRQVGGIAGVGAFGALVAAWPATAAGGPAPTPIVIGFVLSAALMVVAAFVAQRNLALPRR
jgi:MFS transporter, DHA2 family, methylenomycin A resistance protein